MQSAKPYYTNFSFYFTFSGFGDVLLSGLRALSEQYPLAEDYSTFKLVALFFEAVHLFPLNDYIELSFKCQFKKAKIRCQVFNSDWDLARPAVVDDKSLMYSILVV